jgi:hypothetical protein
MLWLLAFSHPLWAAAPKPVTLVVDDVPVVQVLQAWSHRRTVIWWYRLMSAARFRST